MEIGFLVLTDHSEALNGKLYANGAGWNMLRFAQMPQAHGFGIGLGIDVPWNETNRRHALSLHVEGPDGEQLGDTFELEFETGRPPGAIPGQDQRIVLSLAAALTFEVAGPHAVVVEIDGKELKPRGRFYVVQNPLAPLQGAQQAG